MAKLFALIVEDEYDLGELFSITLQGADFDTEVIRDGQAALRRLNNIVPDLVLLDLHLPNVSGKTILEYIRANDRFQRVRVVVVTADAFQGDGLESKADLVLLKPIRVAQLRSLALLLTGSV